MSSIRRSAQTPRRRASRARKGFGSSSSVRWASCSKSRRMIERSGWRQSGPSSSNVIYGRERTSAMPVFVLDSKVLEQLRQFEGRVEIRDQAGELIGHFTPWVNRSLYESV